MRFEILTEKGIIESSAEDIEEMAEIFEKQYPGVDYEIFAYGAAPTCLSLEDYRDIYNAFGNSTACTYLDRIAQKMLLSQAPVYFEGNIALIALEGVLMVPLNKYNDTGWDLLSTAVHQAEAMHERFNPETWKVLEGIREIMRVVDPNFEEQE